VTADKSLSAVNLSATPGSVAVVVAEADCASGVSLVPVDEWKCATGTTERTSNGGATFCQVWEGFSLEGWFGERRQLSLYRWRFIFRR